MLVVHSCRENTRQRESENVWVILRIRPKLRIFFAQIKNHFFGNFFHGIYCGYMREGMYMVVPTENTS